MAHFHPSQYNRKNSTPLKRMKRQLASIFAGVAAMTIAVSPIRAIAQTPTVSQEAQELLEQVQALSVFDGVNFTPAQVQQFIPILERTNSSLDNILTDDQQYAFKEALETTGNIDVALASLNLSPQQETQLQNLLYPAAQQMILLLTPEQVTQLQQNLMLQLGL